MLHDRRAPDRPADEVAAFVRDKVGHDVRMKIAITGSSGLIGTALREQLSADGHQIFRVVRRAPRSDAEIGWNPMGGQLNPETLSGLDAVIHLAGIGIGDRRWSPERKAAIRESRVRGTTTISTAIAAATSPPRVLLSASAVGWYGDTGDHTVDETTPAGTGFLADLCRSWEAATEPARGAGTRVATFRSGLVLSRRGGVMSRLKPLFSLGVGGRLGSGNQYWPWISLVDEVAAIRFLLEHDISGPVNLTGPVPVTNAEFTRTLAKVLRRPAVLPVPGIALRTVLGEFADETILIGQRAVPAVLSRAGFEHQHNTVEQALRWATSSA